jgi:S-adenosylmethionine-diacylgycerolhomoserine-N-methlytransferase
MENVYRYQRHVYDATRRNYLLGRDRLIADLAPPSGGTVLELGCGTGRNLIALARRYPESRLFGIDISGEMLKTARASVARHGLYDRIRLAEADALEFDPESLFGVAQFDRIFFSYSLSMIPDWNSALTQAIGLLKPGGKLQLVDFGACENLPRSFKLALFGWLKRFHVEPRLGLEAALSRLARQFGGEVRLESLYRGYAIAGSFSTTEPR